MKVQELGHLLIAFVVLTIVISFSEIIKGKTSFLTLALLFAIIILALNILTKKMVAWALDANVEHELWYWSRYGFKPDWHLKKQVPVGVILPLICSAFSLGILKCMALLSYETTALKRRAARRFGFYSFTEMTEWHNALIGASGIIITLILSFVSYWIPALGNLWQFAAYYAFWNMIPVSKLDGAQIFFGSRVLWTALALVTLVFTAYAILLV